MQQTGIFMIIGMCALALFIAVYRRRLEFVINFILRGVVGTIAIYAINSILLNQQIEARVGINLFSVLTSGTLGIPGVFLLYGVQIYHFL